MKIYPVPRETGLNGFRKRVNGLLHIDGSVCKDSRRSFGACVWSSRSQTAHIHEIVPDRFNLPAVPLSIAIIEEVRVARMRRPQPYGMLDGVRSAVPFEPLLRSRRRISRLHKRRYVNLSCSRRFRYLSPPSVLNEIVRAPDSRPNPEDGKADALIEGEEKIKQTEWNDAEINDWRGQHHQKTRVPDVGWQPPLEFPLLSENTFFKRGFSMLPVVTKLALLVLQSNLEFLFERPNAKGQILLDLGQQDHLLSVIRDVWGYQLILTHRRGDQP